MKITVSPKAEKSLKAIGEHIREKGYPETSDKYLNRLKEFAYSLSAFPNKYPICRFQRFAKHNFHCATFERSYVFVYKVVKTKLVIYNIIHGKRLK
jgi:plasmid stabilization system protein ParE